MRFCSQGGCACAPPPHNSRTCTTSHAVTQRPHFKHFSKSMVMEALLLSCHLPSSSADDSSSSHSWLQHGGMW